MIDMGEMKDVRDLAASLGREEPDDGEGALLAQEYGMNGQAPEPADRDLEIIEAEIIFYKNIGKLAVIEIGMRLNEAKAQLSHGEWLPWLREKVDISEKTAQNWMRIAREKSKSANFADLGVGKALELLTLPDSERDDFVAERHEVNGEEKTVSEMTVKELKQAIRDRDEARLEAERARADAQAAEDSRAKMEADMVQLKELQKRAQEAADAKAEELAAAEARLADLQAKPVEVAVQYQTDPAELAKAREEGLSEARRQGANILNAKEAELAKAREKADKLREDLKKAQAEAKAANVNLQEAEKELRAARTAAEKASKAAEVNSSGDFRAFKLYFDQAQRNANEMEDLMRKSELATREKMAKAMVALAESIRKAAER